ncbi:Protein of unknown function [Gryllus bimaculatus]|nr:Protein of unknown function [Gryllus bimaculatus]
MTSSGKLFLAKAAVAEAAAAVMTTDMIPFRSCIILNDTTLIAACFYKYKRPVEQLSRKRKRYGILHNETCGT